MLKKSYSYLLAIALLIIMTASPALSAYAGVSANVQRYNQYYSAYANVELPLVKAFQKQDNGSRANDIIARAIWYMENGYMVYGHSKYKTTGYIDCSNFVALVFNDFGYNITSAARKYNTVGTKVSGVSSKKISGTSKYTLVGVDKLKPGDIFTFWNTDSSGQRYISHVAIYMGKINGKPAIIHTVSGRPTAIGITTSFSYWYGQHFAGARRVLGSSAQKAQAQQKTPAPVIPAKYQLPPQNPIVMPK
ncbi:MAG TPA: NlpC/P60 family protein [Syntrophomonas sp.]|nr:NlpC/P60 family protein [Syntrophomonas sp.]